MSGKTVTVDAEWALHVRAGREGRVLACSTGELDVRNFLEAIGRFNLGTPEELPQVSVSFVPTTVPDADYLALAIHEDGSADDRDADKRLTALMTRYFCMPYYPLAAGAVSYRAMYQALDPIRLPHRDAPPIGLTVTAHTVPASAGDDLAMQAAALLLTTRPVCVLGADGTTVAERLTFIDAVMSLLPYGMRTRMAAATWARAADRDHRFRLFFSDTARAIDPPDNFLVWGHPGETDLTAADDYAHEYLTWLRDKVCQPTARLASSHRPMRFRREEIQPVLDEIGIIGPDPSQNYSVTKQDLEPRPAPRTGTGREQILRACARHLRVGSQGEIKSDISQLKTMANDPADDDQQRARYRQILKETNLLKLAETQGRGAIKLYGPLLRVAVTVPLSYEGYCQIEDCLENSPPPKPLLQAIESAGMSDQLAAAIVYKHLWNADQKRPDKREPVAKRMADWRPRGYADADQQPVDATQFIHQLAAGRLHQYHAWIVCDVMLDCLGLATTDRDHAAIRMALHQHGFLASALPGIGVRIAKDQVSVLFRFLKAAYPDGLDKPEIMKVLTSTQPTPALLAAVLLHLRWPSDAHLARQAFMDGSIRGMQILDRETWGRLTSLLPVIDAAYAPGDGR